MSGLSAADIPETTPGITAPTRLKAASQELLEDVDGFFARAAIAASLTPEERREILRGMVLTRAVDNRLKQLFIGSDVQFEGVPFQGKGFRSLGQEAIYAAAIRLRRGEAWRDRQRGWRGDVVGPIIRDLGVALAMRPDPETIRMVLNAQMAKQGPPMNGKDLHIGDWEWGILPATAPLSVSTMSIAGTALAFCARGIAARRRVVHRRRRIIARRMARGDQPLRRQTAAGDLLHREQPDCALDAAVVAVGGARLRRQGARLRHSRHHHRRHRPGRGGSSVCLGGRPCTIGPRTGAHRARHDAHGRSRAPRRHALSRQRDRAVLELSVVVAWRVRRS